MRRYKTVARILLTLSAINFAFAAPVALRGIHEVCVDVVDPSKDGTTTQKTWNLSDERSMNAADSKSASSIPRSLDSDHWSEQGPHNARSPTDSNDVPGPSNPRPFDINAPPPPSPEQTPTDPNDAPGPSHQRPLFDINSSPSPSPEQTLTDPNNSPRPSNQRPSFDINASPPPSPEQMPTDPNNAPRPSNQRPSFDINASPPLSPDQTPTGLNDAPGPSNRPLFDINAPRPLSPGQTPETHPLNLPSTIIDPSSSHPPNPWPGDAPLPAAFPKDSPPTSSWDRTPASSSSMGSYPSSWDRWETAEIDPSSPSISSEPSTVSSINPSTESPPPNAEPEYESYFAKLFKGKIRRRISSSSDATQGKFQGTVDSRVYRVRHCLSSPSPANFQRPESQLSDKVTSLAQQVGILPNF
jgi:hypothetical protein